MGVLDASGLRGVQRSAQEHLDDIRHGGKSRVFGQALTITVIDLLNDDGKFETRERKIERDL